MLAVVSCTKIKDHDQFMRESPLGKSIEKLLKLKAIDYYTIFFDNKRGLSECYNQAIDKYKNVGIDILFVHDDVYLSDIFLREKVTKAFEDYDVIGVAGSSSFSLSNERIGWHLSPREHWSGSAEHPYQDGADDGKTYWSYFGPTPKQVAVIDGLFIGVKMSSIEKPGSCIRFNESFKFHGYDTSFCLDCLKGGLKIGVTNIHCTHMSHGEGFREDQYIEISNQLREQYGEK